METKFELSEQDHRYLFENANDAIWVHDMRVIFWMETERLKSLPDIALRNGLA